MYRINLYPEYRSDRRAARARTASTALLFTLLGVEALLVGALVVSGSLLGEQVDTLGSEVTRLQERLAEESRERPELTTALDLLEVRRARVDWSPKLLALYEHLDRSLALSELEGRAASKREPANMTINGEFRSSRATLDDVTDLVSRLSDDLRMQDGFDTVSLGNIRGDSDGEFEVLCQQKREGGEE